jgi:hypothetical protein
MNVFTGLERAEGIRDTMKEVINQQMSQVTTVNRLFDGRVKSPKINTTGNGYGGSWP